MGICLGEAKVCVFSAANEETIRLLKQERLPRLRACHDTKDNLDHTPAPARCKSLSHSLHKLFKRQGSGIIPHSAGQASTLIRLREREAAASASAPLPATQKEGVINARKCIRSAWIQIAACIAAIESNRPGPAT